MCRLYEHEKILKQIKIIATDNVEIPDIGANNQLDAGEVATLPKRQRNKLSTKNAKKRGGDPL